MDETSWEIWTPDSQEAPAPGVILQGDLMARRGTGIASILGPELAARGYVAIAAPPAAHRDTREFKKATLAARVTETESCVTALFERMVAAGKVDIRRVAVIGHGVGGATAVAEAANDSRVGAVIAVSAPRTPDAYFPKEALDAWSKGQTARIQDPHDGTIHELDRALADDWRARPELDHATAARRTGADVIWIHGTADETVPVDESRRAYWKHPEAGRRARLVEVQGADHRFTSAQHQKKLVEAVLEQLESVFRK